jgi:hypothetical protein
MIEHVGDVNPIARSRRLELVIVDAFQNIGKPTNGRLQVDGLSHDYYPATTADHRLVKPAWDRPCRIVDGRHGSPWYNGRSVARPGLAIT